jgi:hypothetical protein
LQRDLAAKREGRQIGVNGRPNILSPQEENEFMDVLKVKYEEQRLDLEEAHGGVRNFNPFLRSSQAIDYGVLDGQKRWF